MQGEDRAVIHPKDLQLARRTLAGDAEATEEFVDRMRCVRRFLSYKNASYGEPLNAQELEDTAQNTLLAMWKKLDSYTGSGCLEAWAHRFSYLELLKRVQSPDRRPGFLEEAQPGEHSDAPTPEDPLEYDYVYRALERLGEDGEIVRMKHFDGLIFDEIGARLSLSPNTVQDSLLPQPRSLEEAPDRNPREAREAGHDDPRLREEGGGALE